MIPEKSRTEKYAPAVSALFYWVISFWTERLIFDMSCVKERLFTYVSIKILALMMFWALFYLLFSFVKGIKTKNTAYYTVLYSLPYTCILLLRRSMCLAYPYSGDEANIFAAACRFDNIHGMFNYMTTYAHMLTLQLFPNGRSDYIVKNAVCGLAVGYAIYRVNRLYKNKCGFFMYLMFFVPYVIDISWSTHRMQMYGPLYLFFASKLWCDYKEKVPMDKKTLLLLTVVAAILSQWRMEGIYLLVLAPVLICIAYRIKPDKKVIAQLTVITLTAQLAVYIPQKIETSAMEDDYIAWRSSHLYNYLLPNMLRNGLDKGKNAEELAIVDRYFSVEEIENLNAFYGKAMYYDELLGNESNGIMPKPGTTVDDLKNYESAVLKIVIKNPLLFVKSQLGAFLFISTNFGIGSLRAILYTVFANLIIPALIMISAWVMCFIRKERLGFWLLTGALIHAAITTAMLPAAYFKYYYMQYILTGALVTVFLAERMQRCSLLKTGKSQL